MEVAVEFTHMSGINWGDVPTWLAAFFTGGAFAGALLLFRVEAKRDARQDVHIRQAQASLVTAWLSEGEETLDLNLQNASSSCVFNVYTTFQLSDDVFDYVLGYHYLDVLRPGPSPRQFPISDDVTSKYGQRVEKGDTFSNIRPSLVFRDSSNRWWKRDKDGYLTEPMPGERLPDDAAERWRKAELKERRLAWKNRASKEEPTSN